MSQAERPQSLSFLVGVLLVVRLLLNTARRFAYPFAPALARGMGVDLTAITSIIAMNQGLSLLGVVSGPLTDCIGFRRMMFWGMILLTAGMLFAGLVPVYAVVMGALLLAGLGKILFDPALQSYMGDRIPFHRRGQIMGILEISWAGSSLVGLPLLGLLMDKAGWRAPFFVIGVLSLVCLLALRRAIPREEGTSPGRAPHCGSGLRALWAPWRTLSGNRPALGVLGFVFFRAMANDCLLVVYAVHLERQFGLGVAALGAGAGVIGAAELLGEFLVAWLGDRMGLKRGMAAGMAVSGLAYALLPACGGSLALFLGVLFLVFVSTEFAAVAGLSLSTELARESRATMMAGSITMSGLGRMVGALIGVPIWLWGGMGGTGVTAVALTAAGIAFMGWGLRGDGAWSAARRRQGGRG